MDIDALAKQFSDFYYNTFDTDRTQLTNLYVPLASLCPLVSSFVLFVLPLSLSPFPFVLFFIVVVVMLCYLLADNGSNL